MYEAEVRHSHRRVSGIVVDRIVEAVYWRGIEGTAGGSVRGSRLELRKDGRSQSIACCDKLGSR